ncbi:MAG: hypothetical protein K2N05_04460, partial [Muribaculaceae bacterium]|nr:hypothetical protein [Muribaculaceae bacterium]
MIPDIITDYFEKLKDKDCIEEFFCIKYAQGIGNYYRGNYLFTRVRDKNWMKKLNRQLEKVADSFGN